MAVYRSRSAEKSYRKYLANKDASICDFCAIQKDSDQYIAETASFKIIKNRFPYTIWDWQRVEEHIMLIPKTHHATLSDLSEGQAIEYMHLIHEYEQQGYNLYTRAPNSKVKSVVHQHAHLIKTGGPTKKFILQIEKPYLLLSW
jgi:diadenosine tetraphosphate (Ap4A) HIT family hydrolase